MFPESSTNSRAFSSTLPIQSLADACETTALRAAHATAAGRVALGPVLDELGRRGCQDQDGTEAHEREQGNQGPAVHRPPPAAQLARIVSAISTSWPLGISPHSRNSPPVISLPWL